MIPGSTNPLLLATAAPTGYNIERSLRFNSSDSAYCGRSFSSAGNRKKWTYSLWVKRSALGVEQHIFSAGVAGTADDGLNFDSSDRLSAYTYRGSLTSSLVTTQVFRDCSAWYHILWAWDTDNATAAQRSRLYVNGVEVTAFSTGSYPASGTSSDINNNVEHSIGDNRPNFTNGNFSGYLAEIHFIDGQALTPTSFGEFDVNNVWQPKAFSGGSYGTNGFQLKFADNSAATAAALGKDTSSNGHNWTPTNLSVTAGAGNDSLVDSPTNYGTDTGVGAEVRGNYCTLNPLTGTGTKANGNLEVTGSGCFSTATISPPSGKWYWEVTAGTISGDVWFGIYGNPNTVSSYVLWGTAGNASTAGGTASFSSNTIVAGDIIGCAWNMDTSTLQFYRNGSSVGTWSGFTLTGSWHPGMHLFGGTASSPYIFNFGQRPFAYTAPSGFKALCTANLPTPTIANGATAMDVKLYTGNGSTQTISGLGFSPDLVWFKSRSNIQNNLLSDTVRGSNKQLFSSLTDAEQTDSTFVTSFTSDGFSLGNNSGYTPGNNTNGHTYVAWAWDAGSSTVTNTSGSISSQVRASTTNGCSVVTYTGTGANATVGHGLGVSPGMIIVKSRNLTYNWIVAHSALTASYNLQLNTTDAASNSLSRGRISSYSSSTFTLVTGGYGPEAVNASGSTYVAYCFAPVAGYSAFGSYTGNGSADGPFVFTGMRPRWILVKRTDSTSNWTVWDAARNTFNYAGNSLYPNLSNAEDANTPTGGAQVIDILSNGFKLRDTGGTGQVNASGGAYVWAAFAESPFAYSRAR